MSVHMTSMTRPYGVVNQGRPLTTDQLWASLKKYDADNDYGLNKKELNDALQSLVDKPGRLPDKGGRPPSRPPNRGGRPLGRGGRQPDERPHALHPANADGDGLIRGEEERPRHALHHADADGDGLIREEVLSALLH
ncbi:hypothetical protein F2P56_034050 [Juglans regia]|uniref:EF-hand domain-containing protein n=1 Tax=Juglans regia TaxID=51240 RepID=A0A833TLH4_JUGRE|nr:hypothetical protein F2P56_037148 [Juglans regia]KAF5444959.1 hypothetical protein F2P56_034050 [Juglans regia]